MRRFLTGLLRIAANIFFRDIEVVGEANVPADAPVIFAVNHPNGLVWIFGRSEHREEGLHFLGLGE